MSSSWADWLERNRLTVGSQYLPVGFCSKALPHPVGLWSHQLSFHSVTQLQNGDKSLNLMKVPWAAIQGFHRNAPSHSWTIRASVLKTRTQSDSEAGRTTGVRTRRLCRCIPYMQIPHKEPITAWQIKWHYCTKQPRAVLCQREEKPSQPRWTWNHLLNRSAD